MKIPLESRIFVNRTLNMNNIKLIGFDMDYTIVTYNVPALEEKTFELVLNRLIKNKNYPNALKDFNFDYDFIIRGLVIDIDLGNILKINKYGYVKKAAHGTRFLSLDEQKKIYNVRGIDLTDSRFYIIHTLFSIAEGYLFAKLVDYFESNNIKVNYRAIFSDIRNYVDEVHRDGSLKNYILNEPNKYIISDENIVKALQRLKYYGKKLALITNSDYEYTNNIMNYCFTRYLGYDWKSLFDLIVVSSNKPDFFTQKHKFLFVDEKTGYLKNFYGKIELGKIYQGGNAYSIESDLGLGPSEILYLGDHIIGDVLSLKKATGWRTGLVVQELSNEIRATYQNVELENEILKKIKEKETLEDEFYILKERLWEYFHTEHFECKYTEEGIINKEDLEYKRDLIKEKIQILENEIIKLYDKAQAMHNKYWGEVMRAGLEESRFATIVERYACIYMSSIANLLWYSPYKYFRPNKRMMAHDYDILQEVKSF